MMDSSIQGHTNFAWPSPNLVALAAADTAISLACIELAARANWELLVNVVVIPEGEILSPDLLIVGNDCPSVLTRAEPRNRAIINYSAHVQ